MVCDSAGGEEGSRERIGLASHEGAFSGFTLCVAVGEVLVEPYVDLRTAPGRYSDRR